MKKTSLTGRATYSVYYKGKGVEAEIILKVKGDSRKAMEQARKVSPVPLRGVTVNVLWLPDRWEMLEDLALRSYFARTKLERNRMTWEIDGIFERGGLLYEDARNFRRLALCRNKEDALRRGFEGETWYRVAQKKIEEHRNLLRRAGRKVSK